MIQISGLQKVVSQSTVIDIDELLIPAGEIAAVVGPAGSGKARLLDLLLGKTRPTVGSVRIGGVDPLHLDEMSALVGVLFAEDGLYTRQSTYQNLAFQARLRNLERSRIDEVLDWVGLADHAAVRVDKLPSGLTRRLAFGRAILHKPQILFLVSPFSRCDRSSILLVTRLIRDLSAAGTAVLILADDNANLNVLCNTVYLLKEGRIAESYHPQEEQQSSLPFKIPVRLEGKVALVNPVDILYADAGDGRAYLQTRDGRLSTQFTLSELEDRLARSGFFRAHRSYLVNLQHVKEVIPYTRNSFSLRLDDGEKTEIPLSKAAAGELRELLGY